MTFLRLTPRHATLVALSLAIAATTAQLVRAETSERGKLAVMPVEDRRAIFNPQQAEDLTEAIRQRVVSTQRFIVIPRTRQDAELKRMIAEQKRESYDDCYDDKCQIPLGRALSADVVLRSVANRLGAKCTLSAELVDLEKEATVGGSSVDFDCTGKNIENELPRLIAALFSAGKPPTSAVEPKQAGFGAGLDSIAWPDDIVTPEPVAFDVSAAFTDVNVEFLELVDRAMTAEKDAQLQPPAKAKLWEAVAKHSAATAQWQHDAMTRRDKWLSVADAAAERERQLARVRQRYGEDYQKLKRLLALNEKLVSSQQKQAYAAEFDKIYAPLASVVGYTPMAPPPSSNVDWIRVNPSLLFARHETTVAQYQQCVDSDICTAPDAGPACSFGQRGKGDNPVNCVDAKQAERYCAWVGGRLPTDAEWAVAAEGVKVRGCETAVMWDGAYGCGRGTSWPVCSRQAGNSPKGLCDLVGNVWEWTTSEDQRGDRVLRGGSWRNSRAIATPSARASESAMRRSDDNGFRCVSVQTLP